MPHPVVTTVTLAAAVANGIAQSQSPAGAIALTLNGSLVSAGVANLVAPRRVIITSAGNDSNKTFTIVGTRGSWWGSQAITEVVTGANAGIAVSTQDFFTVTSITTSAATAGAVTAGTNETGSGPWVVWDAFPNIFDVSMSGTVLAGTPTYSVECTYDDVFGLWLPAGVPFPRASAVTSMTGKTAAAADSLTSRVVATRLTLSVVGSVQLTQQQQG